NSALYARLYRKHHAWLLTVNHQHETRRDKSRVGRVNWAERDKVCLQKLKNVDQVLRADKNTPRRSKASYLKSLGQQSTLEKNLYRLPRTAAFLSDNAESVAQYQVR